MHVDVDCAACGLGPSRQAKLVPTRPNCQPNVAEIPGSGPDIRANPRRLRHAEARHQRRRSDTQTAEADRAQSAGPHLAASADGHDAERGSARNPAESKQEGRRGDMPRQPTWTRRGGLMPGRRAPQLRREHGHSSQPPLGAVLCFFSAPLSGRSAMAAHLRCERHHRPRSHGRCLPITFRHSRHSDSRGSNGGAGIPIPIGAIPGARGSGGARRHPHRTFYVQRTPSWVRGWGVERRGRVDQHAVAAHGAGLQHAGARRPPGAAVELQRAGSKRAPASCFGQARHGGHPKGTQTLDVAR